MKIRIERLKIPIAEKKGSEPALVKSDALSQLPAKAPVPGMAPGRAAPPMPKRRGIHPQAFANSKADRRPTASRALPRN